MEKGKNGRQMGRQARLQKDWLVSSHSCKHLMGSSHSQGMGTELLLGLIPLQCIPLDQGHPLQLLQFLLQVFAVHPSAIVELLKLQTKLTGRHWLLEVINCAICCAIYRCCVLSRRPRRLECCWVPNNSHDVNCTTVLP